MFEKYPMNEYILIYKNLIILKERKCSKKNVHPINRIA